MNRDDAIQIDLCVQLDWSDILPCPPQHSYQTTVPTEVLMRCAERYDLSDYT